MNEKIGTILSIAGGLALLVVLLLASACSAATSTPESPTATPVPPAATPTPVPPTAAPTTAPVAITALEDIAGIKWESGRTESDCYLMFTESGQHRYSFIDYPLTATGEAWFDGGQLHLLGGGDCAPDEVGIWEVQGVPGEYLSFTVIDEPCESRRWVLYGRRYYPSAAP